MQKAQEAAAETKAKGKGALRLIGEGGVVELELFQCGAELLKLGGIYGVEACKDHGLYLLETGYSLLAGLLHVGDGVSHLHLNRGLDAGDDVSHVSGLDFTCGVELEL